MMLHGRIWCHLGSGKGPSGARSRKRRLERGPGGSNSAVVWRYQVKPRFENRGGWKRDSAILRKPRRAVTAGSLPVSDHDWPSLKRGVFRLKLPKRQVGFGG